MYDIITIRGTVGSDPRFYLSPTGVAVTTFRVASNHRVRDRETGEWVDGTTNWYSVSAFRQLAEHTAKSLSKGQRVIVQGRLRIRNWTAGDKSGTSIDLDADTVGHDLAYGRSEFLRVYQGSPAGAAGAASPGAATDADDDDETAWGRAGDTGFPVEPGTGSETGHAAGSEAGDDGPIGDADRDGAEAGDVRDDLRELDEEPVGAAARA